MERKHKITIPEPCHESWDKMTPNENGRFCMNCSKTVIDFSAMLPDEIQHFFIQNQNKKICGRFKNEQLDSVSIQIPSRILHTQTHYHKMFLLALFVSMGTTLFSCQDKEGKKQKIDKVEVVEDTITRQSFSTGEPTYYKDQDTIKESIDYDAVFNSAALDVPPNPEGGMKQFYAFVNDNYVIPNKTQIYNAKIYVSFIVEKDGSLSTFTVRRDAGPGTGEEAIRVLKMAPKWNSGKLDNHLVRTSCNLPISFKQ